MHMKKPTNLLLFFVLASAVSAQEHRQQQTIPDTAKNLGEVVVTGQYRPQSIRNSVYQVRSISAEQIRRQSPSKLQDVLNNQLNIRFSQDLSTGGSDMSMLGLSGQNVRILIDGVPMTGRQGTSNEININQVEVNSIERIEIIEGPMSVVYGADALAGVINIITKKPGTTSYSITARVQEETVGKEYGIKQGIHNQYIGGTANYRNFYFSGGVGRNLFQGWKDSAIAREITWHKKDQIVANALVGYRKGGLNAYYRLDGLDEIITNPANLPGNGQPAIDQDYITDRLMQQLQASYLFNQKISANAQTSYTHFTRQVYSTLYYPDGDVRVATAPGLQSMTTFNGFTFRGTVVYRPLSCLSFQPGVDVNIETGEGERIKTGLQKISDYAGFLTAEYTPLSWLNIRPGIRIVHNSVYDAPPVIPSVNTKFAITHSLDLRLAYARGFRSPSLRELYYDFFDASHSIMGNPDLKAEHSNSFTGSLTWTAPSKDNWVFKMILNGFYNDVTNMIGFAGKADNPAVTTYLNIDLYKTRGASISGNLVHKQLELSAGFGYTGRFNAYSEDDKALATFKWSPEVNLIASYGFPKIGLDLNMYYKYTGALPYYQAETINGTEQVLLVKTDGYHWADFTVNKRLFRLITASTGVRNLFDVTTISSTDAGTGGAHSVSGARPIGYGRSYFLGLTFNLAKDHSNSNNK